MGRRVFPGPFLFGVKCMGKKVILMIDDSKLSLATAQDVLKADYSLYLAESASEGFEILDNLVPDLILLDIVMPQMDGYEMLSLLKSNRRLRTIPVIFLTADSAPESEVKGFDMGAVDFIVKPFVESVMKRRIATALELAGYQKSLEKMVAKKVEENEKLLDALSTGFAELVESRDGITGGHVKNTGIYFKAFVQALRKEPKYRDEFTDAFLRDAIRTAPLHDIGKIGIDDAVLRKKGSLEGGEREYMEKHAQMGGATFAKIRQNFPENEFLKIAEEMALFHHERWDGKGYPTGISGEEIPLCARIMSIVDVYDALTSERPYKKPFSHEKSMEIIQEGKGTQFDPDLIDMFVKYEAVMKRSLKAKIRRNK